MVSLALYVVDFLEHDAAGMEREAAVAARQPGVEDLIVLESETAAYGGELARARGLTSRAAGFAQRVDQREMAGECLAHDAVRQALAGNMDWAKRQAQAVLALANGKHVEGFSGIALGLAGDPAVAERLAGDLGKRFAQHTIVQFDCLPMIHAAMALRNGDPGKAIDALAASAPYELGQTNSAFTFALYPVYFRGCAYLAAKPAAAAGTEFQKILNHAGVVGNQPIGALARLGVSRAYVLGGDSAKARIACQDFFRLWKDADPDIPVLKQAKAEDAKLP